MSLRVINERQAKILETLSEFQFLTLKELLALEVATDYENLRQRYLKPLAEGARPLIKFADFGFEPGKGRLPRIYFLTKAGTQVLAEYLSIDSDSIVYPIGKVQFKRDYHHRIGIVDIRIALRQWANAAGHLLDLFDTYYDVEGSQRGIGAPLTRGTQVSLPILKDGQPATRTIVPDANFRLVMNGKSRLFTLELHRSNKTARIAEQLRTHLDVICEELLAEKYDHPNLNYVLSVHEQPGTIEPVRKLLRRDPAMAEFQQHFLFSSLEDAVGGDFGAGWTAFDGSPIRTFPTG